MSYTCNKKIYARSFHTNYQTFKGMDFDFRSVICCTGNNCKNLFYAKKNTNQWILWLLFFILRTWVLFFRCLAVDSSNQYLGQASNGKEVECWKIKIETRIQRNIESIKCSIKSLFNSREMPMARCGFYCNWFHWI